MIFINNMSIKIKMIIIIIRDLTWLRQHWEPLSCSFAATDLGDFEHLVEFWGFGVKMRNDRCCGADLLTFPTLIMRNLSGIGSEASSPRENLDKIKWKRNAAPCVHKSFTIWQTGHFVWSRCWQCWRLSEAGTCQKSGWRSSNLWGCKSSPKPNQTWPRQHQHQQHWHCMVSSQHNLLKVLVLKLRPARFDAKSMFKVC